MRIVVEAIGSKAGGGLEVARSLLKRLGQRDCHRVVALLPDTPELDETAGSVYRAIRFPAGANLVERHLTLSRVVPEVCVAEGADVLLCLGNFAPPKAPCPVVVYLQNAWYVYHERPAWSRMTLREKLVVGYGRRLFRARSTSAHVIVQTPLMKQRLAALRGGDDTGITVIPSVPFLPPCAADSGKHERVRGSFSFLCISRYSAHKNFEILVEAVKILRRQGYRPFRCLLTTAPEHHPGARGLLQRIGREGLGDLIANIGPVPRERVADVYGQADAHLLPTLLETAGLTYDEAMHFGLPILTSDRDFARERCQDAAVYFDPLDATSVAKAMARVMEGPDLRARLVENGRRILAKSPSWEGIADRFVEVLERVAMEEPATKPRLLPVLYKAS